MGHSLKPYGPYAGNGIAPDNAIDYICRATRERFDSSPRLTALGLFEIFSHMQGRARRDYHGSQPERAGHLKGPRLRDHELEQPNIKNDDVTKSFGGLEPKDDRGKSAHNDK
jgi:hypothetical protein